MRTALAAPRIASLLALLALAPLAPALAQEAPKNPNAALDYWRAWALSAKTAKAQDDSPFTKIRPAWEKIGDNTDPAKMPEEFNRAKAEVSQEAVAEFLRAARAERCDFQVHFEDGWKALLPELAIVRDLATQVRVDARVRLMEGDAKAATDRVVAIFSAARHVATEKVLISTLVGAAITRNACDEAKTLATSPALAEADRARLLGAIRGMQRGDPLNFRGALEGERAVTSTWVRREYTGEGGPARFAADLGGGGSDPQSALRARKVAALNEVQFREAVARLDEYYDELLKAWDQGKGALVALEKRVLVEDFGPVTAMLAPSMTKAWDGMERINAELKAAEEAVMGKGGKAAGTP